VIVVLTGVDEPRLVRDLIQRGVDEVLMKPIEYSVLAARVAALVQRRHEVAPETQPKTVSRFDAKIVRQPATAEAPPSAEVVAAKIAEVRERLPAPPADFDAFQAATDRVLTSCDLKQAVAAQAEVGSEVINLANSVVFATTQKISSLEGVISELRQSLSFGRIAAMTLGPFVAGIVLGWLLAILTPS
jgi:DNA-binding response OmpR family regulator